MKFKKGILFLVSIFFGGWLVGQTMLTGKVLDDKNQALVGASITVPALNIGTLSSEDGTFELALPQDIAYRLIISYLGKRSIEKNVDPNQSSDLIIFKLQADPLELSEVIITGIFQETVKLNSSIASSSLSQDKIQQQAARGTADLLKAIPGIFADAAAGEIFTRVYSRGISALAEDDIGWYYMSLQEDGLPVTNYQTTYYGPDLFHRVDLTTRRLEVVRGGAAAITSANAPGGIVNFISETGGDTFSGKMLVITGLQGDNNGLFRYDINLNSPLQNNWALNIGGFYRYDQGPRNTDITWANGGQLKANISKQTDNGSLVFYAKYLNDQVNRYGGLAAKNWQNVEPAFGQNFNTTALLLPKVSTNIIDGRVAGSDPNASYSYDSDKGVATKDLALGIKLFQGVGDWTLRSNLKGSIKSADWQSTIANQPLGLEGFFPYLLSGIDPTFQNIPLGQVVFRDAQQGNVVASVNNLGILGPFQGAPASFEYIEGSLPNDAVMGIAPWKKLDEATEVMEQLTISRETEKHHLTFGSFFGYSDVKTFTSASYAYATYENSPRMLAVSLENSGEPIVHLSDPSGVANYGGLLYNRGDAIIQQIAFFANDQFQPTDRLTIDGGVRYERIRHKGEKDRSAPFFNAGGIDGDETTAYNNSVLLATTQDPFDFKYDYFSWSIGFNYKLSPDIAFFTRFSNGHKSPEMNYYFNNFNGVPINEKGIVQDVLQGELGYKLIKPTFSLFATAFWSQLDNVAFSEFVFDQAGGGIFFTPTQFNKTTTVGLEIESILSMSDRWNMNINATYQNAEATKFHLYDANGTVEEADDELIDYSGNELSHNPDLILEIQPNYVGQKLNIFATWRYMSARQANISNGFQLPGFSTINTGINYQLSDQVNVSLIANNVFNSVGLMNFFGPNEFGSNANAAAPMFVEQNPDATFVVLPINPRSIYLKIGYDF